MADRRETTRRLIERAHEVGFALAGVAPVAPTKYEQALRDWLGAGRHGEMHYLARHLPQRLDPRNLLPGARSVLCVADRYGGEADEPAQPGFGRVARYARGDDYHKSMKKRLHALADELAQTHPGEAFRACVDTAPVLERELAQRAGLGAVGKHTLLIEPGVGSWLLLGELITTLELEPSDPVTEDPCGTCTRCVDACPTGAISPWSVDATACLSYLTIEHRTAIDPKYDGAVGDWLFGCDVCQEVCPHNQPTERSRAADTHDAYAPRRTGFDLLEVLGWDEAARRAAFTRSALKRARLDMMKRNALLVAGDQLRRRENPALRARVHAIAHDPSEPAVVRETAARVLDE